MFQIADKLNHEVALKPLPDLPVKGHVVGRQAIGHLDPLTGLVLLDRLVERSAYGAEKFGQAWKTRDNCAELCEETTDAIVYGMQETARLAEGLTPIDPGSETANKARELLASATRYAALADHFSQLAQAEIQGRPVGRQ